MRLGTKSNGYADELGDLLEVAPKAVLAAIAVSYASCGGDYLERARENVLREWWTLYDSGVVPQRPKRPRPTEPA